MELKKQIKNLTDRWLTRQKMSEVLNVDENVINQTLEEIGMKKEVDEHEALIEKVSFAHNKGMDVQGISVSLGINPFQVKHIINNLPKKKEEVKMEIKENKKIVKTWSKWTDEEIETLKKLVGKKHSVSQIATKMKKSYLQVAGAKKRYILHPNKNVSTISIKNDVKTIAKETATGNNVQISPLTTEFKIETKQEEISSPIVITIDRGNKLDIIEYLVKNNIKAHIEL